MTSPSDEAVEPLPSALEEVVTGVAGPPLTVLSGPAGVGRTHVLGALRRALGRTGRPVVNLRLAPEDRDEPWYLLGRLLAELTPAPVRLVAGRGPAVVNEPSGAMLARVLRDHPGLVVLVDDAHCADARSAAVLLAALPGLVSGSVRCVAAWRSGAEPDPALAHEIRNARAGGLIRVTPLRPLGPAGMNALVRQTLQAVPHASLSVPLRRLSRGRPAALLAALEGYRRAGMLRVVDRNAYLTDPDAEPAIPAGHDLLAPVDCLTPEVRAVARALAVLAPLGHPAPGLVADALDLTSAQVHAALTALRWAGVAVPNRSGWRITAPVTAVALRQALGPYERTRVARAAVEALWSGRAWTADPRFLPDQVAAAGAVVDVGSAVILLREGAADFTVDAPATAARWWATVAALTGDLADRFEAVLSQAGVDLRAGRYTEAGGAVRALLDEYADRLPPAAREEAEMIAAACADPPSVVAITQVEEGEPRAGSRRREHVAVLDRLGRAAIAGDPLPEWPGATLPPPERALYDWRAGRWDAALDAATFSMAADLVRGRPSVAAAVHRAAAEMLLAKGRPARARTVLEAARSAAFPLPHLLGVTAAEIEWLLGDAKTAARLAEAALAEATGRGVVLGADELWLTVAELARERGDDAAARDAATSATAAAEALGTPAAELRAATARMIAAGGSAAGVLRLARELHQPYELARALERAVRWGGGEPAQLAEAYDLLGNLGALLHRSRVRQAMRDHGVTVPGRARTLTESELLLATLVAEGLSNRELASATQSSEKSVEGRLTRLFTRAGYRSRVELAAAVLAGDYHPG